jgi:hypothetical protein
MIRIGVHFVVALMLFSVTSTAATFRFDFDPFAGTNAGDPGRQVIGGEPSITFDIANDVFSINPVAFGVSDLSFLNSLIANIPTGGFNVVVLQDTPNPFAAGIAATEIANQVTDPGPGFFIYFNSNLVLPRLVFSQDLSDPTADLRILARMINLDGQPGRDALPTFSAANFLFAVPEPASLMMTAAGLLAGCAFALRRRRQ